MPIYIDKMQENKNELSERIDNQKLEDKDTGFAIDLSQRDKSLDFPTHFMTEANLVQENSPEYQSNYSLQWSLICTQDRMKDLQYKVSQTSSWGQDWTENSAYIHTWRYCSEHNKS